MIRKAKRANVIFLAILISAALSVSTAEAAPSDPTVRVEPARLDVGAGEPFEVQVMIDDVEDLGGYELRIAYDPSVIELTDAAQGDFLGSTGRMAVPVGPQIDEEEGTAALGALSLGQEAGVNGSGLLVTLSGTALKDGSSPLRLEKVEVFNTAPEALSVTAEDGEVRVGGSNPPPSQPPDAPARTTPWAWILAGTLLVGVAAALAFALLRRKPQGGSAIDAG